MYFVFWSLVWYGMGVVPEGLECVRRMLADLEGVCLLLDSDSACACASINTRYETASVVAVARDGGRRRGSRGTCVRGLGGLSLLSVRTTCLCVSSGLRSPLSPRGKNKDLS